MVEKIWFEKHPVGLLAAPILWPLSLVFGAVARRRRNGFLSNRDQSYKAPVPVVVVGNITVGGNGKTPVVVWLVETLQKFGFTPGVVSRGYGGKAPYYPFLVEQDTPPSVCGDEPVLIAKRTGAPVAVSPKRSDAVKALLDSGVDIIITDDGLQHYALDRDIEFAVVDGERRFGNRHYMPMGPLREQTDRLESVDFIICNGGMANENEIPMVLAPSELVNMKTGEKVKPDSLERVVAMAGIGNPARFFNTLESLGVDTVYAQPFADHQAFEPKELERLATRGQHLVMTEKDAVKCQGYAGKNWWYLPVEASFPAECAEAIINRIEKVKERYGSPSA